MTPERWQQIRDLLENVLELEPGQRASFLDQACTSDPSLRNEVEALLDAGNEALPNFLESSPSERDALTAELDAFDCYGQLHAGQLFADRFLLVRKLGEGGMGQVWLAEQIVPVQRSVALKLIKAGMYDQGLLQRFQSERQSLAIMDHPAIAKVFDAGATPLGQPYFVMEHVPGVSITEYCDRKKLKIQDRLELFIQACEAVQHAHQKAIIHRDLKPANILVVEVDGKPVPRIIDFGLAKAIATQVERESISTEIGQFLGTPGYMSPEQADPNVRDIDTRTDVYSLGVVLYELLAGSRPFDTRPSEKLPLDESLRRLREEEPPSPSAKVGADPGASSDFADARGTEPKQLVKLLRGDLDWITMKALEKDRARRYATPSELAADIGRYLRHDAILARPASKTYQLRKYVRRHRVTVAFSLGLVMLLAAFSLVQAVDLRRITRERDRANRITDFMTTMFRVSDPREARGNSVTAREILDKASQNITTGLSKDPELQADLAYVMASTYEQLGLFSRAQGLSQSALDIRRRVFGAEDRKTLESANQMGWILDRESHYPEAEKLLRESISTEQRVLGADDPVTLDGMDYLAVILGDTSHLHERETLERQIVELRTRRLGPEHPGTIRAMEELAIAIDNQGRYSEAEGMYRNVLRMEQHTLGSDAPLTLTTMGNLANSIQDQGRYAEAEDLYRQTLSLDQRVLGAEHSNTAVMMDALGNTLAAEGRMAEAEAVYRQAIDIDRRALGADHPETLRAEEGLANALSSDGQYAEAEELHREILAGRLRKLEPDHTDVLVSKYNIADVLSKEGKLRAAETLLRETLEAQTRVLGKENADTLATRATLANVLLKEGRSTEAEPMAHGVFEVQLRTLGPQHEDTLSTLQYLGTAMVRNHRYEQAKSLFMDTIERVKRTGETTLPLAWYNFACVAAAANDRAAAVEHLRNAINLGLKNTAHMRTDPDLKSLHGDPRFQALLRGVQKPTVSSAPSAIAKR